MKKFKDAWGWIFILAILFSSCGQKITQRYLSQQGHWSPVLDSTGKIVSNELKYDSVYKLEPAFAQKIAIAKSTGVFTWFIVLILAAAALILAGILYANNAGKWAGIPAALFCAAIIFVGGALSLVNWAATKEVEIPKILYDSLQSTPRGLAPFWDQNLLK